MPGKEAWNYDESPLENAPAPLPTETGRAIAASEGPGDETERVSGASEARRKAGLLKIASPQNREDSRYERAQRLR